VPVAALVPSPLAALVPSPVSAAAPVSAPVGALAHEIQPW
jgi:hypothetical protein